MHNDCGAYCKLTSEDVIRLRNYRMFHRSTPLPLLIVTPERAKILLPILLEVFDAMDAMIGISDCGYESGDRSEKVVHPAGLEPATF